MKKTLRIAGYTAGTALLLAGLIFLVAWKSPKYYTPRSRGNYAIVPFRSYTGDHPRPYILRRPQFVLFGGAHTRNPQDSQLLLMQQYWKELKPTVALVEGRLGFLLPGLMDPVKTLGEGGAVAALARKDGIPLYNWDLPKDVMADALLDRFSPQQIALAQVLTPWFGQQRFGRPASESDFLAPFFKRAAAVGLQDSLQSVADVDRYWQRFFPGTDWRMVSDEHPLPGYLHHMMCATNDLRNAQLAAVIKELSARGERVFVVCGSSHAFCVEPAFR
ncbi:MAG: hypothetical protein EOO12_12130 [Chitinophagaceae bacterium]|nr:MAG: hypothetical protein EOO12_12130 [Chitinophagaceae bacterium]